MPLERKPTPLRYLEGAVAGEAQKAVQLPSSLIGRVSRVFHRLRVQIDLEQVGLLLPSRRSEPAVGVACTRQRLDPLADPAATAAAIPLSALAVLSEAPCCSVGKQPGDAIARLR